MEMGFAPALSADRDSDPRFGFIVFVKYSDFSTFTFLIGCWVFYIFVGTPALPLAPEGEGWRTGQCLLTCWGRLFVFLLGMEKN